VDLKILVFIGIWTEQLNFTCAHMVALATKVSQSFLDRQHQGGIALTDGKLLYKAFSLRIEGEREVAVAVTLSKLIPKHHHLVFSLAQREGDMLLLHLIPDMRGKRGYQLLIHPYPRPSTHGEFTPKIHRLHCIEKSNCCCTDPSGIWIEAGE